MNRALPLDLLACPACHGALCEASTALECRACGARYDRVLHVADLVPADVRDAMREGANDPRWMRWREAIRGLDSWRARRRARAREGVLPSDGTSDLDAREFFSRAGVTGVVVDVGAKDGAKSLAMPKGVRYVGIDPFAELVHGLPASAVVVRGIAEALPVADGVADTVVSLAAFDYFVDGRAALREMFRVLKPRGLLALMVSVVPRAVARARDAGSRPLRLARSIAALREVGPLAAAGLAAAALIERERPHTHYYTLEEIEALVREFFQPFWTRHVPQRTSTIVYVAARRRA